MERADEEARGEPDESLATGHAACDPEYNDLIVRLVVLGELKLSNDPMRLVGWTALATPRRWTLFGRS